MLRDPVCRKRIRRDRAHAQVVHQGVVYYLCCPLCQAAFETEPRRYAKPAMGERAGAALVGMDDQDDRPIGRQRHG